MTNSNDFDTLFYQASLGDEEALILLLERFTKEGNKIIRKFGPVGYKHYACFHECIYDTFLLCLKTFEPNSDGNKNFKNYSRFILDRHLKSVLSEVIKEATTNAMSLDDCGEDGRPIIEAIEDKTLVAIPDKYSLDQFKQRISSPVYKNSKNVNLRSKINYLLIRGYTRDEICKMLNISLGVLRYNMKLNREDEELANLKLELK